jgi:hypothetical protein
MATPTNLPATFVAGDILTAAQQNGLRGAFRILQVVSTNKSDTFSMTSTTYADVTGLSVSITPQSATSKILVIAGISGTGGTGVTNFFGRLMRGSTAIAIGDAAGSRTPVSVYSRDQEAQNSMSVMFLDSPATTSATTYKMQVRSQTGGAAVYVNRGTTDADNDATGRSFSSITVLEVSA